MGFLENLESRVAAAKERRWQRASALRVKAEKRFEKTRRIKQLMSDAGEGYLGLSPGRRAKIASASKKAFDIGVAVGKKTFDVATAPPRSQAKRRNAQGFGFGSSSLDMFPRQPRNRPKTRHKRRSVW